MRSLLNCLLLFSLFVIGGCASASFCDDVISPDNSEQLKLLCLAYERDDSNTLETFFEEWKTRSEIAQNDKGRALSPLEQNAYSLYQCYHHDTQLTRLPYDRFSPIDYTNTRYYLVQNSVQVQMVDTIFVGRVNIRGAYVTSKELLQDSTAEQQILREFYPEVGLKGLGFLCLLPEYENTLLRFLGVPGFSKLHQAQDFFRGYIKLDIQGFYHKKWQLVSYPYIEMIFNRSLTHAIVTSSESESRGKYQEYIKEDGFWKKSEFSVVWESFDN